MTHRLDARSKRSVLGVLVLLLVLVLMGCERGADVISGSPLATERTVPGTSISLSPPGSQTPTVSADTAYGLCRTHVADCDSGAPTAVELAVITDTGSTLVEPNTLVWVFSWLGSQGCFSSGGGVPGPNTPAVTPHLICDKLAFIDARTDAFYFTSEVQHQ